MKEWLVKNETTINRWLYGICTVSFILAIVLTIALGRYLEALSWGCALVWLNQSRSWHELAREQDVLIGELMDKLFKK